MNEHMDNSVKSSLSETKENLFTLVKFAIIATCIVLVSYMLNFFGSKLSSDPNDWADFGGYVGGVLGPIFAFLSFLALLLTIIYQRAAQEKQDKALYKQNFEASFFQLLRLYNEIVDNTTFTPWGHGLSTNETPGRNAFAKFSEEFRSTHMHKYVLYETSYSLNDVIGSYMGFYNMGNNADQLGHYFRNLYTIIKFINDSELDRDDNTNNFGDEIIKNRKKYTSIARAQLSNSEQTLLFYNCLSEYGAEKFYPLINKYSLFENLKISSITPFKVATAYQPSAFGDQIEKNDRLKKLFKEDDGSFRQEVKVEIERIKRLN